MKHAVVASVFLASLTLAGPAWTNPGGEPARLWFDADSDGLEDLYLFAAEGSDELWHNLGDGTFAEVTAEAGLAGLSSRHALAADVDADGVADLLRITAGGEVRLHAGLGAGAFEDLTDAFGLADSFASAARILDYDRDGRPDLELVDPDGRTRLVHNQGGRAFETVALGPRGPRSSSGAGSNQALAGPPVTISTAPLAPPLSPLGAVLSCATTLADQAGGCLQASSVPQLGLLYPLSQNLDVRANGDVSLGLPSTTPTAARLHVQTSSVLEEAAHFAGKVDVAGTLDVGSTLTASRTDVSVSNVDDLFSVGDHKWIIHPADMIISNDGDAWLEVEADYDNSGEFDHPLILLSQDGGQVTSRLTFDNGTNNFLIDLPYAGSEMYFKINDGTGVNDWEFQNYSDIEGRLSDLGNLSLDGSVSSPAADLAEYYPLAGPVEPSDVVAFVGSGLELARAVDLGAGEPRLAGIVSSKPGLILGITDTDEDSTAVPVPSLADNERFVGIEKELQVDRLVLHEIQFNDRAPLALSGRVPCKVSAENGPIVAGDLLTVSRLPGHAAKAVEAGAVIGTALQSWDSGTGTILVLAGLGWYAPDPEARLDALERELADLKLALGLR